MTDSFDAIIIGAGVIGAATAFEMAKNGHRTLNIDAMGEAGHGSTSGSCAIVRVYYSTVPGTALAYEAWHYWRDWANYLQAGDERGLAEYRDIGCLVMKTEINDHLRRHMAICDELAIPYEEWDESRIAERLPHYRLDTFWPARRPEDEGFGEPSGGKIGGGVYFPTGGYVTDPALSAHNLQRAGEAKGSTFRFNAKATAILKRDGRVSGVQLQNGESINAPVVVNVAGPASRIINEMAGVTGDMSIGTRAMKQEVVHLPAPDGFFADSREMVISDSDIACYLRPERGGHLLVGSEDPPCDDHVVVEDPFYDGLAEFHRAVGCAGDEAGSACADDRDSTAPERRRRSLRCHGGLDPDLRQVVPAGILHGVRHQRQSIQECAGGGKNDGGPGGLLRGGK